MTLRVLLAGQKSFGAAVFDMLLERDDVRVAHVVSPEWDDTKDRLTAGALRRGWAWSNRITPELVQRANVDLIVAAHSHDFIGRKSRAASRLGAIGYHPSLLPRHRGRDAVEWTIRMGDPIAGGSVYWFTDNVDGGPLAQQDFCFVRPGTTASELWREKLFPMGIRLLGWALDDVIAGRLVQVPQDETYATWEPSLDSPPLFRPELPELGSGPAGYTVVANRGYTGA